MAVVSFCGQQQKKNSFSWSNFPVKEYKSLLYEPKEKLNVVEIEKKKKVRQ